jgi:hypothetical protein
MSEKYQIYQVDPIHIVDTKEDDGILRKNWYDLPSLGRCLFKEARPSQVIISEARTDWSEKVIDELAKLLNLPAARYELAIGYFGRSTEVVDGVLSLDCVCENAVVLTGEELLTEYVSYDSDNPSQYTIENVLQSLGLANVKPPSNWERPISEINTGAKLFVGYMMLDCLVNNSDRHDHNWGVMAVNGRIELIPSYDHGISLGSTDEDADKSSISVKDYVNRYSQSCFQEGYNKLSNLTVFVRAAQLYPEAARVWQDRLARIDPLQINEIFDRLPPDRISSVAMQFAKQIIEYGREQILGLDLEPVPKSVLYRPSFNEFSLAIYDLATIPTPTAADRIALAQATVKAETLRQLNGNDPNTLASFRHESVAIVPGRFSITPPTVAIEPSNRQEIVRDTSIDLDDDRSL